MAVPIRVDLKNQVAVITGGGGILCSVMAKAMAECGAKVAVLDLKPELAQKVVDEINKSGGTARAFACNVLEKSSIEQAHEQIKTALGPVDILINGAGGNHPKGTTSKEFIATEDLTQKKDGVTTFYDLTVDGIQFVFNLNFLGTFLPTQVFSKDMVLKKHGNIINISSMNAFKPLTKIPAYSAAKGRRQQFHPVAGRALLEGRRARQRPRARLLPDRPEPRAPNAAGWLAHRARQHDYFAHPARSLRKAGRPDRHVVVVAQR